MSTRPSDYKSVQSISGVIKDKLNVDIDSIPGIFVSDDSDFAIAGSATDEWRLDAKVGTMKTFSGDQSLGDLVQGNVNYMWAVTFGVQTSWKPGSLLASQSSIQYGNWWSAKIVDNNNWIHFVCQNQGTTATNGQRSDDGSQTFLQQAEAAPRIALTAISGAAPTQTVQSDLAKLLKLDNGVSKNLGFYIPVTSPDEWLTHSCYGYFWGVSDGYTKFKGNTDIEWAAGYRAVNGRNIISSGGNTGLKYTVVEAALALSASAAALYGMSSLTF